MSGLENKLRLEVLSQPSNGRGHPGGFSFRILNGSCNYLVDAGIEAALDMAYKGVFLTHYHRDHTRVLPELDAWLCIGPPLTPKSKVNQDLLSRRLMVFSRGVSMRRKGLVHNFSPIRINDRPTKVFDDGVIEAYSVPVHHDPAIHATGYLFCNLATGKRVWISGDFGRLFRSSEDFLREVKPDLSLIELTYASCQSGTSNHQDIASVQELVDSLGLRRAYCYSFIPRRILDYFNGQIPPVVSNRSHFLF